MIEHWARMKFLHLGLTDIIDIAVVTFIIYKLFTLVQGTRALQMMLGFVLLVFAAYAAQLLRLEALNEIFQAGQLVWVIAILIVFQPELRSALARLGRAPLLRLFVKVEDSPVIGEVVRAAGQLSNESRGAIVAIQREVGLDEYVESGKRLQARVSAELLSTIFAPYTPLHDGAVIIEGSDIVAAACILPLTQFPVYDPSIGTRHRAAIGLSEETDAAVVVVSEETGQISLAVGGRLEKNLSPEQLSERLMNLLQAPAPPVARPGAQV
ncbi:MAG: TIGR00159 family protein [Gemmatimonadetes bacterium]|nr:TIGR00159 family protein [Gemmatimonadota bacterium]